MTTTLNGKHAAAPAPLYVHELRIQNFMRVSALTIEAHGGHVVISGPNARGKTTALTALWATLCGKSPADPIRHGEEKASCRLDLGEYIVERTWNKSGTKLTIKAADGTRVNQPGELLEGLVSKYSIDPTAFLRLRPQDQVDEVLKLVGITPPVETVAQVCGETHPAMGTESAASYLMRLSADQTGLYYVRRRDAGRNMDQKKHALMEERTSLTRLGDIDDGGGDLASHLAKLQELQAQHSARQQAQIKAGEVTSQYTASAQKLTNLESDAARLHKELEELTAKLQQVTEARNVILTRIKQGRDVVAKQKQVADAAAAAAANMPVVDGAIAQVQLQVAAIQANAKKIAARDAARESVARLEKDVIAATKEHERLEAILEKLRNMRLHLLDDVDLGVPGLAIHDEMLTLNGVTFAQASQAQQVLVSASVAMRQKPRVRLCRCDNLESLDANSFETLTRLANTHGYQLFAARVDNGDDLRVEIIEAEESAV